ncbi:MAG: GGDEF domain-containing protein [Gemmatimonadetes bacterium]|nr:GGDEF domain-containing protein [Gemmatimonadota bacterium]
MLGREHAIGHPVLTDASTGLANRLHFELVYSYLFSAADRGVPLTVMLVATGVTDNDGLRFLGEKLQIATRASDLVAHLGEGRIVVLMMGTNISGARVAADRVELSLQGLTPGQTSIGIAAYVPEMKESSELLEAVDTALRAAEAAGGGIEMAT